MNTLLKGTAIFAMYCMAGIIITGIFFFSILIATGFDAIILSIIVGLISALILVSCTISNLIVQVEGNKVLLVVDLLLSKPDDKNNTIFSCYSLGIHFLWPWEVIKEEINLEADIADKLISTFSTLDDELEINFQYDVEPDPDNLSIYVLNGKDEKDREDKLKIRLSTLITRSIEKFVATKKSDEIMAGTHSEELQKAIKRAIDAEKSELGVRVRKVRIGNINYSKDVSDARNDTKTIEERNKSLDILMAKRKDGSRGLELKEAIQFLQAETGKSTRVDWNINTPPTLKKFSVIGAHGVNPDNSKKKGK